MLFPVSLSTRLPIAMISLVSEAFTDKTMSGLVPKGNMSFMVKFLLLPRCTLGSSLSWAPAWRELGGGPSALTNNDNLHFPASLSM